MAGWVVVAGSECRGFFSQLEDAAAFATREFPTGNLLIRHTDERKPEFPLLFDG